MACAGRPFQPSPKCDLRLPSRPVWDINQYGPGPGAHPGARVVMSETTLGENIKFLDSNMPDFGAEAAARVD